MSFLDVFSQLLYAMWRLNLRFGPTIFIQLRRIHVFLLFLFGHISSLLLCMYSCHFKRRIKCSSFILTELKQRRVHVTWLFRFLVWSKICVAFFFFFLLMRLNVSLNSSSDGWIDQITISLDVCTLGFVCCEVLTDYNLILIWSTRMQVDAQQAELLSGSTVRFTSDNLIQWMNVFHYEVGPVGKYRTKCFPFMPLTSTPLHFRRNILL